MQRHYPMMILLMILCIMVLNSLLYGLAGAQALRPTLPHLVPVSGRPPASVLPPARFPQLPVMPYPYPRVYIDPSMPTSPSPDAYTTNLPPSGAIPGNIQLAVKPLDVEIYINGQFIGRSKDFSGSAMVPVAPGGHLIELRLGDVGNRVRVFVSSGETVELNQDLSAMHPETAPPTVRRWTTPAHRQPYP